MDTRRGFTEGSPKIAKKKFLWLVLVIAKFLIWLIRVLYRLFGDYGE